MANLTIVSPVSLSDKAPFRQTALVAGEELLAGSPCYIASDGTVMQSISSIGTPAEFDGFCLTLTPSGSPVTLFGIGTRIRLAASLTIGTLYYPSDTKGLLSDAAIDTGELPLVKACSATDVRIVRAY